MRDLLDALMLVAAFIAGCWALVFIVLVGFALPIHLCFKACDAWNSWKQDRKRKKRRAQNADSIDWRWPLSPF